MRTNLESSFCVIAMVILVCQSKTLQAQATGCPISDKFERYESRSLTFSYPKDWKLEWNGPYEVAIAPSAKCGVVISLKSALIDLPKLVTGLKRETLDIASRQFFGMKEPAMKYVAYYLPATLDGAEGRLSIGVHAGYVHRDTVAIVEDLVVITQEVSTLDHYVSSAPVLAHIAQSVTVGNKKGGTATAIRSAVGAKSGKYEHPDLSFEYPANWLVQYEGKDPDPDAHGAFLVCLSSPDVSQFMEVRYLDAKQLQGTNALGKLHLTAQRHYGDYYPSPIAVADRVSPPYWASTNLYDSDMSGKKRNFWAAEVRFNDNLAHISFVSPKNMEIEHVRKTVLQSIAFSKANEARPVSFVGRWEGEGTVMNLYEDRRYEQFSTSGATLTDEEGVYKLLDGNKIVFLPQIRGSQQTCSYRLEQTYMYLNCRGHEIRYRKRSR